MMGLATLDKFYIKLQLTSEEPETSKRVWLSLNGGSVYASKVERSKGETLDKALKKEVKILLGREEYEIIDMKESGYVLGRNGNKLPRVSIILKVSYFDPSKRKLEYPVQWRNLEISGKNKY